MKKEPIDELRGIHGVSIGVEDKPDTVSLADVQHWCEREERVLRLQYKTSPTDPGTLPVEWELGLRNRRRQPTTMSGALSRWAYLSHLYRVRSENLSKGTSDEDVQDTLRQMLKREPVMVPLSIGDTPVTARSYTAMLEIARHSLKLRELESEVMRQNALEERILDRLSRKPPRTIRRKLNRRLQWLYQVHRRLIWESRLHRQAIYAHAFTVSGAPALSLAEAPEWWDRVTPEDDAILLRAMFDVGVERFNKLPEKPDNDNRPPKESFGWHSLFASVERSQKLKPAELYDRDLFQLLAWLRVSDVDLEDELGV